MVARDRDSMDEEYARRLQRQYDLELRREEPTADERPPPVAPSPPRPSPPSSPSAPRRGSNSTSSPRSRSSAPRTPPRRSTQQGRRNSGGGGAGPASPPRGISISTTPPTSPCTPTSSPGNSPSSSFGGRPSPPRRGRSAAELVDTILDQEYARKIEQQLRDEELALRMQQKEMAEREAHRIRAQYGQRSTNPSTIVVQGQSIPVSHSDVTATLPRGSNNRGRSSGGGGGGGRGCCFLPRKICSCVIFTVVLSVTVAIIFGLLGGGDVPIPYVPDIPDLGDIFMEDPWDGGSDPSQPNAWRDAKRREGLDLTIINALTDDWYPYFGEAVQDWDDGTPDALSLRVASGAPDPKCVEEVGKMKVCNGDYGNTGWKGVNEVMLQNEFITLSVAKMNEYYLAGSRAEEKQYTMCHEMGHGFGLGHSDENFFNSDLGTCMDYTNRPQNNQHPNESNFNLLLEVYGYVKVDRDRDRGRDLVGEDDADADAATEARSPHRHLTPPKYEHFSSHGTAEEREGANWRLLARHPRNLGEVHELDLGDGFRVQAHVLLADDDDDRDRARARERKGLR